MKPKTARSADCSDNQPNKASPEIEPEGLAIQFESALADDRKEPLPGDLKARLERLMEESQLAWPGLTVSTEHFVRLLAERLAQPILSAGELPTEKASELYIGLACAQGDSGAIAAFEQRYFTAVEATLKHQGAGLRADVGQMMRLRLFVAAEGQQPKILQYAGEGLLQGLVRVMAQRIVLDLAAKDRKEEPLPSFSAGSLIAPGDPQLALLKGVNLREFKRAFGEAVTALTTRQRNLLRLHLVDRLSIDDLGRLFAVHRASAARWVADAREEVAAGVRRRMTERLQLSEVEFEEVLTLIRSGLDLSLERLLAEE